MVKDTVKKVVKKVEKKVEEPKNFVTDNSELAEKLQEKVNIIGASDNDSGVRVYTFACTPEEAEKLLEVK